MSFWEKFFTAYNGMSNDAAGAYSWKHLLAASVAFIIYLGGGILLGLKFKNRGDKVKVIKWTGIVMLLFEIIRIFTDCLDSAIGSSTPWTEVIETLCGHLPLFLCSTFLIVLPLITVTKGKFQQGMIDFIYVFGIFSSIMGTFLAANIYARFPIFHVQSMCSLLTHSCAGFAWAFIATTKMESMTKKTIPYTLGGLGITIVVALIIDIIFRPLGYQHNYMFLFRADGTPFEILISLFGEYSVGYTISVIVLQIILVPCCYLRVKLVRDISAKRKARKLASLTADRDEKMVSEDYSESDADNDNKGADNAIRAEDGEVAL